MMLTVIVIPTNLSADITLRSVRDLQAKIIQLEVGRDFNCEVDTKWKLYLYGGEILSQDLKEALPEFLLKGGIFDLFEIYRKSPTGFSISPRLFKADIRLQEKSLMPVHFERLNVTTILDGFIQ